KAEVSVPRSLPTSERFSPERPSTSRRALLFGGVAFLALGMWGCRPTPLSRTDRRTGDDDRIPFLDEGNVPMGIPFGEGLDGRQYTDLSRLPPGSAVIPSEQFFVRTRASELLAPLPDWPVHVGGLIRKELTVSAA